MTRTVRAVERGDGAAVERITKTSDQTKSADSNTIGVAIPSPTTSRVAARSLPPNGSASWLRRIQPSSSSVPTTVKPTQAPPNITHQSVVMLCSGPECGVSTDWPDPVTARLYPDEVLLTAAEQPDLRRLEARDDRLARMQLEALRRRARDL